MSLRESRRSAPWQTSLTHLIPQSASSPIQRLARLPPFILHQLTSQQITLGLLEQAKALDIPSVWLQPGAEDETVIQFIKENGLEDRAIYGGPCVLVEGDGILKSVL